MQLRRKGLEEGRVGRVEGSMWTRLLVMLFWGLAVALTAQTKGAKSKAGRISTPPPTQPPLMPVDAGQLPAGTECLELYLLLGQSNMKGRGVMPEEAARDPRVRMMHLKDDQWYVARHPLHLTGDAKTFAGHDNAGVGPGLAFAERLIESDAKLAIGLVPCAVGGSSIKLWQRGAKLYDEAVRRAKLALQTTGAVKTKLAGVLWLQGEADAAPAERASHEAKLLKLVDDLRADLGQPELPFLACTIGEMSPEAARLADQKAMNEILLSLPKKRPHTACVDARDLVTHIGDRVHFDTVAQEEIGRRFAQLLRGL